MRTLTKQTYRYTDTHTYIKINTNIKYNTCSYKQDCTYIKAENIHTHTYILNNI